MNQRLLAAVLIAAAAGLAGCDGGSDATNPILTQPPPPPPPTPQTFFQMLTALIATRSCETTSPVMVNGVEFTLDDTLIDVSTLSIGCTG